MLIYVIQPGDTIYSIALAYNVSPTFLIETNQLTNPDNLVVGQTIVITNSPNVPQTPAIGTLSINGYAYPYIDESVLRETLPSITSITLFTYGFTYSGNLIPIEDSKIIEIANEYGVQSIMLISTLTSEGTFSNELAHVILNDINLQNQLIDQILQNLQTKGYHGLDVDFEYVFPEDRTAYVNFIRNLTSRLNPAGYPVYVALAPKTSSNQPGLLYEAHDYAALGEVANYVLLMTYEWGYTYGPPMAVAPLNKVKEVLDYAITQIDPGKIYMGIPNYGYDWTLPFISGESKARSIGNVEAIEIASRYQAIIQFDEIAQSPFFYYTDEEGRTHVVWFEDARSIDAKVRLANSYGFFGISYWTIMKYFPQNWLIVDHLFQHRV